MLTNETEDYPDTEAVLARLEEEDPPAHVRAVRLAALHIEMATANYAAVQDMRQRLRTVQEQGNTQGTTLQKIQSTMQRHTQEIQRGIDARMTQVELHLHQVHQALGHLGKRVGAWRCVGMTLTGALVGTLVVAALWMMLSAAQVLP